MASPLELCNQLQCHLANDSCSTHDFERQAAGLLHGITAYLQDSKPTTDVVQCIGGRGSSVVQCLTTATAKQHWLVVTAAVQCLHALAQHLLITDNIKNSSTNTDDEDDSITLAAVAVPHGSNVKTVSDNSSSCVVEGLQQLLTRLLQTNHMAMSTGHGEAVCWMLHVSQLLLQAAPHTLLHTTFITTCRPYLFYGLPAYRRAVQGSALAGDGETDHRQLWEEVEGVLSSDHDHVASGRSNYSNKNRRKRLRRKNTQHHSSSSSRASPTPASHASPRPAPRSLFASLISSSTAAMPPQLRPPDPAHLNSVTLKPQWMQGSRGGKGVANVALGAGMRSSSGGGGGTVSGKQTTSAACRGIGTLTKAAGNSEAATVTTAADNATAAKNVNYLYKDKCGNHVRSISVNFECDTGLQTSDDNIQSNCSTDCTVLTDPLNKLSAINKCEPNDDSLSSLLESSSVNIASMNGSIHATTANINISTVATTTTTVTFTSTPSTTSEESMSSSSDSGDPRAWSSAALGARVRQCALATLTALVTAVGTPGRLSAWVPLLTQSPALLQLLLVEPRGSVRSSALQLLAALLTDAGRPLALATDGSERAAYSSLCQQLGSSIREVHRVLGQVLSTERSTDGVVRVLKSLELLLECTPYARLAPGLLTATAGAVKPYVSHEEAVVQAAALSVLVSLVRVQAAAAEVRQLLLRYAVPGRSSRRDNDGRDGGVIVAKEGGCEVKDSDGCGVSIASGEKPWLEDEEEEGDDILMEELASSISCLDLDSSSAIDAAHCTVSFSAANATTTTALQIAPAAAPQPQAAPPRRPMVSLSRSLVWWLVGRCAEALLPTPVPARGVYVQVQLQSLRLLSALVSSHFLLVAPRLALLQKVISAGCGQGLARLGQGDGWEAPDAGVVVEHVFPLLFALFSVFKRECEVLHAAGNPRLTGGDEDEAEDRHRHPGHDVNTCSAKRSGVEAWRGATTTALSGAAPNDGGLGTLRHGDILWEQLSLRLWMWALQDPLHDLLLLSTVDEQCRDGGTPDSSVPPGVVWWWRGLRKSDEGGCARRLLVAAADVLTLLTPQVVEGLGEQRLHSILRTVQWLTQHSQPEVSVWGVRVCGCVCGLAGVQRCPLGGRVLTAAVVAGTALLEEGGGVEGGAVNKHRLVAVAALANVAAALKHYSNPGGNLLPHGAVERLLEAAMLACDDKSKIRPHGVRCLGSTLAWLRQEQPSVPLDTNYDSASLEDLVSDRVVQRALSSLLRCASTGNNMKMRWNACHALARLLHCPGPIGGGHEWRTSVLSLLCALVSSFPNSKVRIQACLALCSTPTRPLFGTHYRPAWRALLAAAGSTRNVADYLELRHRDDLTCQVVQGMWHLSCLVSPPDCAWLRPLLLEHRDTVTAVVQRVRCCLPPHGWRGAGQAQQRVQHLLQTCDALTDNQVAGLSLLQEVLCDGQEETSTNSQIVY